MKQRKHPVVRKLEAEVESTLSDFGFELVQMKFGGGGDGRALSVFIDGPNGVTADDCQQMNRRLSMLLDVLDPVPGAYTLVVSSPGLDRPLSEDEDFQRFAGEKAAIRYMPDGGQRRTVNGILKGLADDKVVVDAEEGLLYIPLAEVEEAHLTYDWDAEDNEKQ